MAITTPPPTVTSHSPWQGIIDMLGPLLQSQMGMGSGPMYPGVRMAQRSPMQDMARQMMMNRAGGPMAKQHNPFSQPGYKTGDLGQQQGQQGGQGMPSMEQMIAMMMQGQQGGGMTGGGNQTGPPPGGGGRGGWPGGMPRGAESVIGANAPFFTPAINPWAPFGGQNPAAKGQKLGPLVEMFTSRQGGPGGGGREVNLPGGKYDGAVSSWDRVSV